MMEVFKWLSTAGAVTPSEMSKTFNIGIGMVLVVPPENVKEVQCALGDVKEKNCELLVRATSVYLTLFQIHNNYASDEVICILNWI